MSLINCPECSNSISDTTLNCPYCGMVIRELRRGFWGLIFQWAFILFNILMIAITFESCSNVADFVGSTKDSFAQAGATIGFSLGMGALIIFWASVDIILGLFVFFTRPKISDSVLSAPARRQKEYEDSINQQNKKKFLNEDEIKEQLETGLNTESVKPKENNTLRNIVIIGIIITIGFFFFKNYQSDQEYYAGDYNNSPTEDWSGGDNDTSQPKACSYLKSLGIETGSYIDDESEEAKKICFSNYIEVGKTKENNIAYYAYGNSSGKIERVVLTLGLTDKSDEESTLNEYEQYIATLFKKYTGTNLSSKYLSKVRNHQPFSKKIGNYSISMEKNGKNSQYGLVTQIKKMK